MTPDERVKAAAEDSLPPFEDLRVQLVYRRIREDADYPPNHGEQWDSWISRRIVQLLTAYDSTRPPLDPATVEACEKVCRDRAKEWRSKYDWAAKKGDHELAQSASDGAFEASLCASAIRALALTPGEKRS